MSGAFVFTPTSEPQTLFPAMHPQNSPFLPSPSLFPGTPSPYTTNIPLPGFQPQQDSLTYDPMTGWLTPRSRRASFSEPHPNALYGYNPVPPPPVPSYVYGGIGGHQEEYPHNVYSLYQPQRQVMLHPWLDGDNAHLHPEFWCDLSTGLFAPMRIIDTMGTRTALTIAELSSPATHPPCFMLRITNDATPQWPMQIGNGTTALTLGDVLTWVWKFFQLRISHDDWGVLESEKRRQVGRAYRRRCEAFPIEYVAGEKAQGVKRVDYLLGKVLFKGLTIDYFTGSLKMVTA